MFDLFGSWEAEPPKERKQATTGVHHRKPQLIKVQRTSDHVVFRPKSIHLENNSSTRVSGHTDEEDAECVLRTRRTGSFL